ncbi:MAG: Ppx/GppA family phosphatase [Deltaproteobacteria bacterium]|nr:Ppx/GppA family phosphatase [Deltaproteobacteria bacterium]
MSCIASIDIGSQTIRLMIAEYSAAHNFTPLHRAREIVRLGESMNAEKPLLQPQSIERAVGCIKRFVKTSRTYGAAPILAVATACVRNAHNRETFLKAVTETTGITPQVITGSREAQLSRAGVCAAIPGSSSSRLIIDIGGGSTELIYLNSPQTEITESLPLGVIRLAEEHLKHDPPLPQEVTALKQRIHTILTAGSSIIRTAPTTGQTQPMLIGTAGTITTLSAMSLKMGRYDPDKINGHVLSAADITSLFNDMIGLPLQKRSRLLGLETGRALVIIPGTLIIQSLMELFRQNALTVSDAGLLEGIIINELGHKSSAG